ncbi:phage tail protein [Pseudomonas sp. NBRC 111123]|jgi:microcystin-dependent protein|uniref:phage tail protein n=1 Tax=Pseudomonas sp. NBRC 111123 TaxID=1661038 RepID=UPI0007619DC4|nr:tail fiber protein [Pseudomonas sp. NBRC 111123]
MSDPFIGEIKMFAGNFAPRGYSLCNGQLTAISQNTALFSLLGTTYGGDGVTTFALPNFQGRSPIHWGTGVGLQPVELGEFAGVESVSVLTSNMPAHNHTIFASTGEGTSNVPLANGYLAAAVDKDLNPINMYTAAPANQVPLNSTVSGSSIPLQTRSPYLSVSFIIALMGEYPSRS